MVNKFQHIKYTLMAGGWLSALLLASLLPTNNIPQHFHLFEGEDKVIHMIMYTGLCFLSITASSREKVLKISKLHIVLGAMTIASLTEVTQSYIPGRSMSAWDMVANTGGVGVGLLLANLYRRLSFRI